jgi:hypothetical protein
MGVSSYRLSTRGTGFEAGMYLRKVLNRRLTWVLSVPGLSDSRVSQFGPFSGHEHSRILFPEVRIETRNDSARVTPFVGAGVGYGIRIQGNEFGGLTLHGILGIKLRASERTSVVLSVTGRSVDPGRGRTIAAMLGLEFNDRGGSRCLTARAYPDSILPWLDSLVTGNDSVAADMRAKLQLEQSTSRHVALVKDRKTCAAAALAIDSLRNTPNSGRKVYVFKLGPTRYGVADPGAPDLRFETGARMLVIYSTSWAYLKNLMH